MGILENRVSHLEQQMARSVTPDAETQIDLVAIHERISMAIASVKAAKRPQRTQEEIKRDAIALTAYWREKFAR